MEGPTVTLDGRGARGDTVTAPGSWLTTERATGVLVIGAIAVLAGLHVAFRSVIPR